MAIPLKLNLDPRDLLSGSKRAKSALLGVADGADKAERRLDGLATRGGARMRLLSGAISKLSGTVRSMGTAFSASIAAAMGKGAVDARSFDAALAEVSTLIEGTEGQMSALSGAAIELSRAFGGAATEQVKAFYQTISAGTSDIADATELMGVANQLAMGGVTDITTAVDGLTTVLNSYGAETISAAEAADIMFTGVKAGKTTIAELSSALGQVLPVASSVGIAFDDVVSSVAALTTQGLTTSQAVTGVRAAIAAVIKPTKEAADAARALGIDFSTAALESQGFGEFISEIIEKTGGNQAALSRLFGSIEAVTAVLAMAGGAGEKYNAVMLEMAAASGAAAEASEKVASQISTRLDVALAKLKTEAIQVGGVLLRGVVPALETLANNIGIVEAAAIAFGGVLAVTFAPLTGIFIAAAGAVGLVARGFGEASPQISDAENATRKLNAALNVFSSSASPKAAGEAINLGNKNVEIANTAYEAAQAELAKAEAILAARKASADAADTGLPSLLGGIDPAVAAELEAAERGYAELLEMVNTAKVNLDEAIRTRTRSARMVTGASGDFVLAPTVDMSGVDVPDGVSDYVQSVLDQLDGLGDTLGDVSGGGSGISSTTDVLNTLIATLDPAAAAAMRYAEAEKTISAALESGQISKERAAELMSLVAQQYSAASQETGQFLDEMQSVSDVLKSGLESLVDSITDRTKTASEKVSDFLKVLMDRLLEVLVVQQVVGSFDVASGTGSGIVGIVMSAISGVFGGFRADGGDVRNGETYVVGEEGEELLTMTPGGGFVTSNRDARKLVSPRKSRQQESTKSEVVIALAPELIGKVVKAASSAAVDTTVKIVEASNDAQRTAFGGNIQEYNKRGVMP